MRNIRYAITFLVALTVLHEGSVVARSPAPRAQDANFCAGLKRIAAAAPEQFRGFDAGEVRIDNPFAATPLVLPNARRSSATLPGVSACRILTDTTVSHTCFFPSISAAGVVDQARALARTVGQCLGTATPRESMDDQYLLLTSQSAGLDYVVRVRPNTTINPELRVRITPPAPAAAPARAQQATPARPEVRLFVPSNFDTLVMGVMPGAARFAMMIMETDDETPVPRRLTQADLALVTGDDMRKTGQAKEAIGKYQEGIAMKPDAKTLARANVGIALVQGSASDFNAAFASLAQALKLYPAFPGTRTAGGVIYCLKGDFETAVTWLREAVKLDPTDATAQYWLGWTLLHGVGSDNQTAITSFRASLKLQPANRNAATGLGMASIKAGLLDDAIPAFQAAIRDGRDDQLAYWFLGLAYLNANRRADAQTVVQRLQSIDKQMASELAKIVADWK